MIASPSFRWEARQIGFHSAYRKIDCQISDLQITNGSEMDLRDGGYPSFIAAFAVRSVRNGTVLAQVRPDGRDGAGTARAPGEVLAGRRGRQVGAVRTGNAWGCLKATYRDPQQA